MVAPGRYRSFEELTRPVVNEARDIRNRERAGQILAERSGTVARGKLTALYDERFGRYEPAKDRAEPAHSSLAQNPLRFRLDVLAEALFLGGPFQIGGPHALYEHRYGATVGYTGTIVEVRLTDAAKRVRAIAVLDADFACEDQETSMWRNILLIQRVGEERAVQVFSNSLWNVGLREVDLLTDYVLHMAAKTAPFDPASANLVPSSHYRTIREAFEGLRERFGLSAQWTDWAGNGE